MIAIAFLFPSSLIMFPVSQSASAFPTADPLPSEYLFYDDFESDLDNWTLTSTPTISTDHATSGTKSVEFSVAAVDERILRSLGTNTTNVVVECWFYDTSTVLALADIFIDNATSSVKLGLRTVSATQWSVWNDVNIALTGSSARVTGWHNLKLHMATVDVRAYVDNVLVGTFNLTAPTNYGFEKFAGAPILCWVDQFIFYRLFQDTLLSRAYAPAITAVDWHDVTNIEPSVLYEGGVYKMWFRAGNGTAMGLGYANSTDGFNWTVYGSGPVCAGVGGASTVKKIGSTYYLINGGQGGWYRRTSADGITWSAETLIISNATVGWKYACGNVDFWVEGSTWYMMYEAIAYASGSVWKIGMATSTNGITWTEYAGNPVLGNAFMSAGGPFVQKIDTTYYMAYHYSVEGVKTGYDKNLPTDIGIVKSTDLISWTNATFSDYLVRDMKIPWEVGQVADPFPFTAEGTNFLYYCGSTDGWDGQIYVATSDYSFAEIATGQVAQWGDQWIGGAGTTNNFTATWPRTYNYTGINAIKGTYFYDLNVTGFTGTISVTTDVWNPSNPEYADVMATFTVDKAATFVLTGLSADQTYTVELNGVTVSLRDPGPSVAFTTTAAGQIVISLGFAGTVGKLVNVIFVMFAIGIVVGVVAEGTNSLRKMEMRTTEKMLKSLLNMVIYIVIGMASLGVIYSVIA